MQGGLREPGEILGHRYRLGTLIGRGAMCDVYRATDIRQGRTVAVKLFSPGGDAVAMARLRAEAMFMAGLSHRGLLRIFDMAAENGLAYLVMQLVDGPTLRDVIRREPLDPGDVLSLAARLTDTLAYVHERQVIHRDIKPSNVLLSYDGEVYLADFGIARAIGETRLTGTGQFLGSAAYLAPEQLSEEPVTVAADVYSLGLVLLECHTGQPEYTGTDAEAALARLSRPPRIDQAVPSPMRPLLADMTARHPEDRPTARECATTLRPHVEDAPTAEASPA